MNSLLSSLHVWRQPLRLFSRTQRPALRSDNVAGVATRLLPPHLFVLLAIVSVQLGAAFAKNLFPIIGSTGTVFLRLTFAAVLFLCTSRPRLRGYTRNDYILVVLFGLCIAGMNGFFYAAIARIPLGIATTLEFVGPLGVALASSRRLRDVLWTLFAAAGVLLLAPIRGVAIDTGGIVLALLAAVCWAAYILLNVRVGRVFPGRTGLALGMSIAALVVAPLGFTGLQTAWQHPVILLIGLGVAVLSSVIPFTLEMEALRRLPARIFGILLSLEPVVSALIGLVILGETVGLRALIAMALIVIASGGVSFKGNDQQHAL